MEGLRGSRTRGGARAGVEAEPDQAPGEGQDGGAPERVEAHHAASRGESGGLGSPYLLPPPHAPPFQQNRPAVSELGQAPDLPLEHREAPPALEVPVVEPEQVWC